MPEPVCMGGAMTCAELVNMLNSGTAIVGALGSLLAICLGLLFVRALWT